MRTLFLIALFMNSFWAQGLVQQDTLYIHRDSAIFTVFGEKHPFLAFNHQDSFSSQNALIEITAGDSLNVTVINKDTIAHSFLVDGVNGSGLIPSGDTVSVDLGEMSVGAYTYYDSISFPDYANLGLGGMIVVKDHSHSSFYWNVKEGNADWHKTMAAGGSVDWTTYTPDFFTISGNSHPDNDDDSLSQVTGSVGDTIYINIANTGRSIHSLHFHGYHADIIYSSKHPSHIGRSKDTFPIHSMETLILRIVPDKPGIYPVHDHNLVATTGAHFYPNGMFTTLKIQP